MDIRKLNLRKERQFGDNLSVTFDFIRMNFKMLLKILLRISGPLMLLGSIVLFYAFFELYSNMSTFNSKVSPFDIYQSGFMILGIIIYSIGSLIFSISINEYISWYADAEENETISPKEIFQRAISNFWNYFGTGLLVSLMIAITFMVLIIPGIYVGVSLSLVLIVISAEKKAGGKAINRSWQLIKGKWWITFGYLIVVFILATLIMYIIQIPLLTINVIFAVTKETSTISVIINALAASITYLIYPLVTVITYIGIAVYYFSVVEEKEQVGLKKEIQKIEIATNTQE